VLPDAVRSVRPGYGLAPKHLDAVVGSVLKSDVDFGTAVSWELLTAQPTIASNKIR
jgi:N-acetylneuraminate synthase